MPWMPATRSDLEQLASPLPEHGQRFRDLFGVFPDRIPAKLG